MTVERDQLVYKLAKQYLLQFQEDGVTPELLEKYLHFSETNSRPSSLEGIYERLLGSAQNANMKAGVIGGAIDGVDKLRDVLCNFDPASVIEKYANEWKNVLGSIERQLKPRGKIRRTPRSIWPRYCRTILSAANFLMQFDGASEFYGWIDIFDKDERTRPALPMLLSCEIEGIGFALACDFLKELGYVNFAKPDSQIREIFIGVALCHPKVSDYQLFKAVVRVAKSVGETPYNVDKLFWLIGSGKFYDDKQVGRKGKVRTNKSRFIAETKKQLKVFR